MALLVCPAHTLALRGILATGALAAALAGSGCIEMVGADLGKYVERDEKHFSVAGKPDVTLSTFDGSIEIRPWDRPDVQVVVEKRGRDKDDVAAIEVNATQTGDHVEVTVTEPKNRGAGGFDIHFNNFRSAKLIVSLPASSDVAARSGDGSIDIERVTGRMQLRSGDGSIRGRRLGGDVTAHTGDGAIKLDGVNGALDVDTGDGSITVAGRLTSVRARSGDGSVTVRAEPGKVEEGRDQPIQSVGVSVDPLQEFETDLVGQISPALFERQPRADHCFMRVTGGVSASQDDPARRADWSPPA